MEQTTTIECTPGDIASQTDICAVVNAANARLVIGGGVAGALHRAAGPGLVEECRPLAPISPGEAVITGAHNLPNRYVIHCLGPVYGRDTPEEVYLASCYDNALTLAEENMADSIAFPSISTGAFGYPVSDAAQIACATIKKRILSLTQVKTIRFVLFSRQDLQTYTDVFRKAGLC